ncbi:MAG: hypothetical protein QOI61_605 [Actinomycetota bacterium]
MTVCVVVADDHGARCASHALRAAGWGGVHFESNPEAAVRVATGGRATVLNTTRAKADDVERALTELGAAGFDWRTPPPDLSQDEWLALYGTGEFTPRTLANRLKSAHEKMGDDFERWRLPAAP